MKPIGAYALALDYKLINYSSQILDSPYYSAEDKKVLKDQYIGVMSPYSEAAQSRSDVWRAWPTNYGGAGGQGNLMLRLRRIAAVLQHGGCLGRRYGRRGLPVQLCP